MEKHRTNEISHPATLDKLQPILNEILIGSRLDSIYEEATRLLHNENTQG